MNGIVGQAKITSVWIHAGKDWQPLPDCQVTDMTFEPLNIEPVPARCIHSYTFETGFIRSNGKRFRKMMYRLERQSKDRRRINRMYRKMLRG